MKTQVCLRPLRLTGSFDRISMSFPKLSGSHCTDDSEKQWSCARLYVCFPSLSLGPRRRHALSRPGLCPAAGPEAVFGLLTLWPGAAPAARGGVAPARTPQTGTARGKWRKRSGRDLQEALPRLPWHTTGRTLGSALSEPPFPPPRAGRWALAPGDTRGEASPPPGTPQGGAAAGSRRQ